MTNIPSIFEKAIELIEKGRWTQFYLARDDRQMPCDPFSPSATSWCLIGALMRHCPTPSLYDEACFLLETLLNEPLLAVWNDSPDRKPEDIIAACERAIQALKESESVRA